jgi:hypothetical protein
LSMSSAAQWDNGFHSDRCMAGRKEDGFPPPPPPYAIRFASAAQPAARIHGIKATDPPRSNSRRRGTPPRVSADRRGRRTGLTARARAESGSRKWLLPAEQRGKGGRSEMRGRKRRRRGVNWNTPTRLRRIKSRGPSIQSIQWRSPVFPAVYYFSSF